MTHFGVGPRIFLPSVIYAAVAGYATHVWPEIFLINSVPYSILLTAGIILLIFGLPMWIAGVCMMWVAFNRGELVTSGVFGLVRHPIYSSWIVFNFPAIALLCRSWPMLATSFVAYIFFRLLIAREDQYLEEKFGKVYLDYRSQVNEVIPIPRFWRKKQGLMH
jgi:protein-S-isoprenylcysteine O-methyltransferase Ste14